MTPAIAIMGAGPAGLMAAEAAAKQGCAVTVYDQMPRPGRKFLLAGRGGLNLTHSEPLDVFLSRYREGGERLAPLIRAFPPEALRAWADGLGADTFVGSSGRVFPKAMKASPLLRAWLQRLAGLGVGYQGRARWTGLTDAGAMIVQAGVPGEISADAIVLALGGASWPELGSDGAWQGSLAGLGAAITPMEASNVGVLIDWPAAVSALAGAPFKTIGLSVAGERFLGEAILTAQGLEGGVVYAAGASLRRALRESGHAQIALDLQPNRTAAAMGDKLTARDPKRSLGPWLHKALGLSPPAARLVATQTTSRDPTLLAGVIKAFPLTVKSLAPLSRAISSAGGLAWDEVDGALMLKRRAGVFVAGEMLDWDAPTGGYLLQACFATGRAAGLSAAAFAAAPDKKMGG